MPCSSLFSAAHYAHFISLQSKQLITYNLHIRLKSVLWSNPKKKARLVQCGKATFLRRLMDIDKIPIMIKQFRGECDVN